VRVVHWFPNFHAGGGIANSVLALASAQAAAGVDIWIVCLPNEENAVYGPMALDSGVKVATWSGFGRIFLGGLEFHGMGLTAARKLRALRPDVVHIHGEFNPDNWWVVPLWRVPIVLSPHGAFHPTVLRRGRRAKKLYIAVARRFLYRRVAVFHALSPAEQTNIMAVLPSARSFCAPQGPSPAVQCILADHATTPPTQGKPVCLMFLGRLDVRTKGLDILVEAFARATRGICSTTAVLIIAGPNWRNGKALLHDLARHAGIEDRVGILDVVPATEVPALFQKCDIYIQLSRNDGSPLSLNDALALGKPAIVSSLVGTASFEEIANLPHVAVVAPTVVDAAQAIRHAINDLAHLAEAAREEHPALREFLSWSRAAQRHMTMYSLLSTGPRG
jgi:glycosyltransferase involved in cell wall biosynthesis